MEDKGPGQGRPQGACPCSSVPGRTAALAAGGPGLPPARPASPASPLLLLPPLPLSHPQGVAVAQGSPCILPPFLMQSEEPEVSPRVVASGPPLFPQLLIPGPLLGFVS